jgi:hypothetical protein
MTIRSYLPGAGCYVSRAAENEEGIVGRKRLVEKEEKSQQNELSETFPETLQGAQCDHKPFPSGTLD